MTRLKLNGNYVNLEYIIIYLGLSDKNNKSCVFQRLFYIVQWK